MEPQKLIVVTPLELKAMIADAVTSALNHQTTALSPANRDEWGGVPLAQEVLKLAESTIYSNIHLIPHQKRHGRLYFNRGQLLDYLAGGGVTVPTEFAEDARRLVRSRQKRHGKSALPKPSTRHCS
jgi:hypothetical protein